ncbi:SDR family NAD(P)-dependent oxidoreductase [Streptomyces sp. NPDC046909]|uniref:SDR family NAD(P)-dependent oxidoreductase n=1 Tax=Streptomyces sp. NPDC046909 TaxID=3155617 RepID=UPI0033CD6DE0
MSSDMSFAERYGPWALVLGGSEGVGAAYARAMAERGLKVCLLARRQEKLDEVAADIRGHTGAEVRTAAVDLSLPDATADVVKAVDGLDVGMVMYCAGADPNYQPFLAGPVEIAQPLIHRNCVVPMQICHHFAAPMVARGRGGIVLVSSAAGLHGTPNTAVYGATKAFDMLLAEGLWTELHEQGVDILSLVLGATDTPALRRTLVRRGHLPDDTTPVPGASTSEEAVAEALAHLTDGPTHIVGERLRETLRQLAAMDRGDAARAIARRVGGVMDSGRQEKTFR